MFGKLKKILTTANLEEILFNSILQTAKECDVKELEITKDGYVRKIVFK